MEEGSRGGGEEDHGGGGGGGGGGGRKLPKRRIEYHTQNGVGAMSFIVIFLCE